MTSGPVYLDVSMPPKRIVPLVSSAEGNVSNHAIMDARVKSTGRGKNIPTSFSQTEYRRLAISPLVAKTSGMLGYCLLLASLTLYPRPIRLTANPVVLFTLSATPNSTPAMLTSPMPMVSSAKGPLAVLPSPKAVSKAGASATTL